MSTLKIDVWSDLACPWCYVGSRQLQLALTRLSEAGAVEVRYRAFELDPAAPTKQPPEPTYVDRLAQKYGTTTAAAQAMIDSMTTRGTSLGIDFRFDRIQSANTFDAHRLLAFAAERGAQLSLVERLFAAHMSEGRWLGDRHVLTSLAGEVGLDVDAVSAVLHSNDHGEQVRADEAGAASLGITGVPFFWINERYGVPGAVQPDAMYRLLVQVQEEVSVAVQESGESCSIHGC